MDPESGTGIRWVQALTWRRAPEYGLDAVKALQGASPRGGFSRRACGDPTPLRRGGARAARARRAGIAAVGAQQAAPLQAVRDKRHAAARKRRRDWSMEGSGHWGGRRLVPRHLKPPGRNGGSESAKAARGATMVA